MEPKWSPKGAKWRPNGVQRVPNGAQMGRRWGADGVQMEPRRGCGNEVEKSRSTAGKGRANGIHMAPFLEPCAYFWDVFSVFFQGRFLIDLLMVFGLIFVRFFHVFFDDFWTLF